MDVMADSIRQIFAQLDAWRHLPAYRLEPRADVFFGLYMRRIVEQRVGEKLHSVVIPELPIRRGTLFGEDVDGANASVKVDYALFSSDGRGVFLVELKTDQGSRRDGQDAYLRAAQCVGMRQIVSGILKIVGATAAQYRPKYLHLLAQLERASMINVPPDVYEAPADQILRHLAGVTVSVADDRPAVEILYVQPKADTADNVIGFDEFAAGLPADDPVAEVFGEYLMRWREPAGAVRPEQATG